MSATADSLGVGARAPAPPVTPLARAVFFGLVVACFLAFFVTQRLKHTLTAVYEVKLGATFTPGVAGYAGDEHISFRMGKTDAVTVTVVDGSDRRIATLVAGHVGQRYRHVYLTWNGRVGPCAAPAAESCAQTETGPLAAPGVYRLRFFLREQDRTIYSPRTFRLEAGG